MLRRGSSFGRKILLLVAISTGAAVILVCGLLIAVNHVRNKREAVRIMIAQSHMIAENSLAAMAFGDTTAANETLAAVAAVPEVAVVRLLDTDGKLFAAFSRDNQDVPTFSGIVEPSGRARPHQVGQWLLLHETLVHDGDTLGSLQVVYDLSGLNQRSLWSALIGVLAAIGAMAVALALGYRLQQVIARPIGELAHTARTISHTRDFSIRAARLSSDELGQLTDTFNEMLSQIEQQNRDIQAARVSLLQSNDELKQRNVEMEQFVYTVSHDLKSPLVTTLGFTGILREDAAEGNMEAVVESTHHIERAARRMSQLIEDLLQLSRVGRVRHDLQRIDIRHMLQEVGSELQQRFEDAGVRYEVDPATPPVVADPVRLRQVFENLITNALKYGCTKADPVIKVGGQVVGANVRYYVQDFGEGIEPAYHGKIFGLFQRLSNKTEGTGVGLAIVSRIMEVHGGKIWVESELDKGATFWLSLPVTPPSHEGGEARGASDDASARHAGAPGQADRRDADSAPGMASPASPPFHTGSAGYSA